MTVDKISRRKFHELRKVWLARLVVDSNKESIEYIAISSALSGNGIPDYARFKARIANFMKSYGNLFGSATGPPIRIGKKELKTLDRCWFCRNGPEFRIRLKVLCKHCAAFFLAVAMHRRSVPPETLSKLEKSFSELAERDCLLCSTLWDICH